METRIINKITGADPAECALNERKINMKKKYYIAYGSNLNHAQMAYRCPDAEFIGTSIIDGYELVFKGRNYGVADIIPCEGGSVPVGIWSISETDERNLDVYEGFPQHYRKQDFTIDFDGKNISCMAYVMSADRSFKMPSEWYFNTILQGYIDCGIDTETLFEAADKVSDAFHLKR